MEMHSDGSISLLDRVKIQSELLVPLLKDLREELGVEMAHKIVFKSLRKHLKNHYQLLAESKPGSGKDKWSALR
jgi:hypothetical protein